MLLPSTILLSILLAPAVHAIWPLPQRYTIGSTPLVLSSSFSISFDGTADAPQDLQDAVARTSAQLKEDKLQILTPDRGASYASSIQSAGQLPGLTLRLTSASATSSGVKSLSEEATAPLEEREEGYTLEVPADGSQAVLSANSTLGLFRGLTTFSQLWYDWEGSSYTLEAPINITDFPAYVTLFTLFS